MDGHGIQQTRVSAADANFVIVIVIVIVIVNDRRLSCCTLKVPEAFEGNTIDPTAYRIRLAKRVADSEVVPTG